MEIHNVMKGSEWVGGFIGLSIGTIIVIGFIALMESCENDRMEPSEDDRVVFLHDFKYDDTVCVKQDDQRGIIIDPHLKNIDLYINVRLPMKNGGYVEHLFVYDKLYRCGEEK